MFILSLIAIIVLGWGLVNILARDTSALEKAGLSFPIGLSVLTLSLFVANYYLGQKLDLASSWVIWGAVTLSLLVIGEFWRYRFHVPKLSFPKSIFHKLLLALLIFLPLSNLFVSFWLPVLDWDAVTMFDYRAKIILDTGWVSYTLVRSGIVSYPLLTSLSHFWVYLNGLHTAMPLYPLMYGSYLLITYSQLRRLTSANWVLPGTLFLAVAPKMFDQSLIAYANLPYSIYLLSGAAYLYLWLRQNHKSDLWLGLLLSILSLWARSFPFAAANILAVFLIDPKTRKPAAIVSLVLTLLALFYLWPLDMARLDSVLMFTKWALIDYFFPYTWMFVALAIWQIVKNKKDLFWPLLITLYFCIYVLGNYYFAGQYGGFAGIPDAAQRMMMFINPAVILFLLSLI